MVEELVALSAAEAAERIRRGALRAEELVAACLARTRALEGRLHAWAFLDPDYALARARAADAERLEGGPVGPLHGVPVGVTDLVDTADMPTQRGSPLYAGRTPARDAAVVARLRAAGAIVIGKTATTELGAGAEARARNPHDPARTAGGSSGGAAAAVAAGFVPLAVGSQGNGSTIRAASFCGVWGFKPTHGLISRTGMLVRSRALDHVGLFARSVEDLALLAETLAGWDERDPDTRPRARPPFVEAVATEPPLPPLLAFVRTPHWERADEATRAAFGELLARLGGRVEEVELAPSAADAWAWHRTIMDAELAASLEPEWDKGRARLTPALRARLERGRRVRALDYQRALARVPALVESLTELFEQRYDALLTPAAPGTAPTAPATGDPVFATLWTLCGMPAVSVPLLAGADGLPLGVQLVGARGADARLLRTARWLVARLRAEGLGEAEAGD